MTRPILLGALAALAIVAAILSLAVGAVPLSPGRVLAAVTGGGDEVARIIVLQLRLPRAVLGLAVGAMLGTAGAAFQGYLRNPLAEPSVLGASNGAALGAVVALYFGLAALHPAVLPVLAVAGALLALLLLVLLAGRDANALSLILAGVAVGTVAGAGISLALNLSPNPFAAMEIMTWLMGSLEDRSIQHVALALPCIAIGLALLAWDARALDALTLGEDAARSMGVDLSRLRARLLLGTAIGVGGAVAVSGSIGFVGLIVPHLVRPLTDRSPSAVLLPSAIGGAALLTFADVAVRLVPTLVELRLGVVTAILGVPVFLALLRRERGVVVIGLEDVSVRLGKRLVVDRVSATFAHGLVGVLGPNGAGKSTLVRSILGLVPADGRVAVDGPVAKTIAYLPQGGAIHWPLPVRRLVGLGRMPHLGPLARLGSADLAAIDRAMAAADVTHLAERDATTLSGGERARVLLARALAAEARALIVDEPLAALDPAHALAVMALLQTAAREGTLVIAVLHDLALAARFCDRILLMADGRVVADGGPRAVLTRERIAVVYGVDAWVGEAGGMPAIVPLAPSR